VRQEGKEYLVQEVRPSVMVALQRMKHGAVTCDAGKAPVRVPSGHNSDALDVCAGRHHAVQIQRLRQRSAADSRQTQDSIPTPFNCCSSFSVSGLVRERQWSAQHVAAWNRLAC